LLTLFTLMMAPLPDEEDLQAYQARLADPAVLASADKFAQVPAWFDAFEAKTETPVALPPGTLSDPEDQEEEERIKNTDY